MSPGPRLPRLSLKGQALRLLSLREQSRVELRRKLLPHARVACANTDEAERAAYEDAGNGAVNETRDVSEEVGPCLDKLLDWLEEHGLLSEERFIESRVRVQAQRYGTSRIRRELSQHGLELTPSARKVLEDTEVQRAGQVLSRKFGAVATDAQSRARQMRFLAARGFSSEAIRLVIRGRADAGETTE